MEVVDERLRAESVTAIFEATLTGEREVTDQIHSLVDHALSERDHATKIFLQCFVTKQIEEEATVNDILGRPRLFGDQGQDLLMIDNELAATGAKMPPRRPPRPPRPSAGS